jgi:GntR family transcriptional regulator, rspAB operon transcriptional repressor
MALEILPKDIHQSIKHWAYIVLRTNIIKLHLEPGTSMSEAEIAETLQTSRTPIREAFIRLSEDGLLEIYPQRGSIVSLIDIEQAEEACFVRNVLGKAVLKEACRQFPEEDLLDLDANLARQRLCQKNNDYEQLFQLDNDFHSGVYRGCQKERVWLHIRKMNYNFDRLRIIRLAMGMGWNSVISAHERITRLIREHDAERVDKVVDEHLPKALVLESAVPHPEYFKQDVREYNT